MNSLLIGVFLPYIKVCLHIDLLDTVQSDHIEFPDGFVIFWRVACCDDYPAFRHLLVSEGFSPEGTASIIGASVSDTQLISSMNRMPSFRPVFSILS